MTRISDFNSKIERGFHYIGIGAIRFRWAILVLSIVVIGLAASQLPKLSMATSVESMFTSDDPILIDYQRFRNQFGRDEDIVLLISAPDVFSLKFLTTLKQFHLDLENSLPLLKAVRSLVNAPYLEFVDNDVRSRDFLDKLPRTEEEAREYRERGFSYPGFRGIYFTPDGKHAMVIIKTLAVSALSADGQRLLGYARGVEGAENHPSPDEQQSISQVENIAVIGIVEAVVKEYQAKNFRIAFSGTPVYQYHVEPMFRANMKKMCIAILLVPIMIMPFLFGRGSGAIFPQMTVVLGLIAALGLMALLSIRFSLTSSMLPATLLSIGLTAPIHFLVVYYKYQKRVGRFRGILATMKHSGFPIAMTSITTVAGLLTFSFSDIVPIAHLVNFTIIGILIILVFTLATLPALLATLQAVEGTEIGETHYEASLVNRALLALGRMGVNRPYPVLIFFLVSALLLGASLPRLHFSHNELHYFSENSDFMRQIDLIESQTGGFRALEILIDTQQEGGIVDRGLIEGMQQLETYLQSQTDAEGKAYVGRTRSLVDVIKEFSCAANGWNRAECPLPEDHPALVEQFDHIGRLVPDVLHQYTDADMRTGRLTAMMYWRDAADDVEFIGRVQDQAASLFGSGFKVTITGLVAINSGIIHAMTKSLVIGYSTGFLLIAALMIVAIGDIRVGLLAMIPNMMPIIIGLGVMGYLDIPLNTYNLIGGSIAIGLAVDDTIHFFHNFRRYYLRTGDIHYAVKETLASAGRALLTTTLILVASFWMRLFSNLKVIADFGLILGTALLVAFLADVLLAPALLHIFFQNKKARILTPRAQSA